MAVTLAPASAKARASVSPMPPVPPVMSPAEVPRAHFVQMGAYAEALRVIFPGRKVEAALLYTAGPRLIPLDC